MYSKSKKLEINIDNLKADVYCVYLIEQGNHNQLLAMIRVYMYQVQYDYSKNIL